MRRLGIGVIVALVAVAGARPAAAQSLLLDRGEPRGVALEVDVPSLGGGASAMLAYAGLTYQVSHQVTFVAELPFGHASIPAATAPCYVGPCTALEQTAPGNPYLGVRLGMPWRGVALEIGYRPRALSGSVAWGVAAALDAAAWQGDPDRSEAFSSTYSSVRAALVASTPAAPGLTVRWRAALVVMTGGDGINAMLDAGLAATYVRDRLSAAAAFTYRKPTSEGDEASYRLIGLAAGYRAGRVTPSLFVRFPLGSAAAWLPQARYSIGVALGIPLATPSAGF